MIELLDLDDKKALSHCPLLKGEQVYEKINELITRLNALSN